MSTKFDAKAILCRATGIACTTPDATERAVRLVKQIPPQQTPPGLTFGDLQRALEAAAAGFPDVVKEASEVAVAAVATVKAAADLVESSAEAVTEAVASTVEVASEANDALVKAKNQLADIVKSLSRATDDERTKLEARAVELLREMKDLSPEAFAGIVAVLPPDLAKAIKRRTSARRGEGA